LFVFILYLMLHVACVSGVVHSWTQATWSIRYRMKTNKTEYNTVNWRGNQEWTTPETQATWSIRYRIKTNKTEYNSVNWRGYCPFLIALSVYCVVFCFVCLHSISYAPCCLCLCIVHSWLPLQFTVLYSVLFVFILYLMPHVACVSVLLERRHRRDNTHVETTEGAIKNGQYRDTGNMEHTI
jgi:hypothetical protein